MRNLQIVILAAGHGTRMKSTTPKILHHLGGRPVLHYVFDLAQNLTSEKSILVSSPALKEYEIPFPHHCVIQDPAQGTGDAVKFALPYLKEEGHVLVLFGDTPLVQKETVERVLEYANNKPDVAIVLLGMRPLDKQKYARLIVNERNELTEVVEHKDLTDAQREISLCNSGVMLVRADLLRDLLSSLTPQNKAQEYYLTDLVKIACAKGYTCGFVEGEASEFMGINTRYDLSCAERVLQNRWRMKAMEEGVTLFDPETIYLSYDTKLAADVEIHPFVVFGPGVTLESGAQVLSFCRISQSHLGENSVVGPFAHLRGGVSLQEKAEVGNFVEVKKSTFGPQAKAKHLSYIGDTKIGSKANIGAGVITCNYDGFQKSKTLVGEGAFVGSNSSLIAPLSIGDYAMVAAGSVVTKDVEKGDLTIARTLQTTIEKGADKFREKCQKRRDEF